MKLNDELDRLYERLLVLQVQTRDQDAFRELVRRYERRLFYYIRRILSDGGESLDVLQEVWLRVYLKIGSLRSPEAFRVWLYKIAHDRTVSHLRKRSEPHTSIDANEPAMEANDPGNDAKAFDNAELVHRALQFLSHSHRETLTLYFLENMGISEISEVMGCEEGTVKSRLHYGKIELKKHIERLCHE